MGPLDSDENSVKKKLGKSHLKGCLTCFFFKNLMKVFCSPQSCVAFPRCWVKHPLGVHAVGGPCSPEASRRWP